MMNNENESEPIYSEDEQAIVDSDHQCAVSSSQLNNILVHREINATNIIVTKLVTPTIKENPKFYHGEKGLKRNVPVSIIGAKTTRVKAYIKEEVTSTDVADGNFRENISSSNINDDETVLGTTVALCSMCGRNFSSNYNLKRHMRTCKLCPDDAKGPRFECHCGRTYSQEWDMKKHKASCKNVGVSKKCKNCIMPGCNLVFYHRSQLVSHMKKDHNVRIQDPDVYEFPSLEEFLVWKEQIEERTYTYYSKQTGSNITGVSINTYYICQHDGSERTHSAVPRKTDRRNKKGRMKTGRLCWSQMNVKEFRDGTVKVTYFPSHTHPITASDTEHHPLPPSISSEIKRRLVDAPSDEDTGHPELKMRKKSSGMNVRTLRALARKNRKLFRITAEAVEDGSGCKESESKEMSVDACAADAEKEISSVQEESDEVKYQVRAKLIEACYSTWSQLSSLIESGQMSDSYLAQTYSTLSSLVESSESETLACAEGTQPELCEQLTAVIYQNESLSPSTFPHVQEPQTELSLKPMDKAVYQIVTLAAKDEPTSPPPEELIAVKFPTDFIIIAKDQIIHTVNSARINLT